MKKILLAATLGYATYAIFAILFFKGDAKAETFTAVAISTGDARCITVGATTALSVPEAGRRFHGLRNISFCNVSTSETVKYRPTDSSNIILHGFPLSRNLGCESVELSPLRPQVTFYFLAPAGSTGAEVCYKSLAQEVFISTPGGSRSGFQ